VTRAIGPRVPIMAGSGAGMWVVLLIGWGLIAAAWLSWVAAWLAAALAGHQVPPFGERWIISVARWRTGQAWPGTPTLLVAVIWVALAAAAITIVVVVSRIIGARIPQPGDPVAALNRDRAIRRLAQRTAAGTGIRLRPSLAGISPDRLAPADIGLLLGQLKTPAGDGPDLYTSWEDTVVAFMGPRSGKTTSLGIPYVLSAPGPVVATSVRADLWAATAELRAASGSGVWVFDPMRITAAGRQWWIDLLDGLRDVEDANRLAGHFVLTIDDATKKDIWGPAAQELLSSLFLAAAVTPGRTLRDVSRWLDDAGSPHAAEFLHEAGYPLLASSLRGTQHGAPETRDGIYQTARTAAKALRDEKIMAWLTPPPDRERLRLFRPAAFATSRDILYLLTESQSAAAPVIAAITDRVMRAGMRAADRAGGRLDPPFVLILDEAGNICRIADLPNLYSHLGGRLISPVTILQTYEQGITVWGEQGMAALWGSATKKLIGAGVDSPRLTRDVAELVGHHDVPVRSISYGDGRASEQISVQWRLILEAADIRAIPLFEALLLAPGARPALIRLRPWQARRDAPQITAARNRAVDAIKRLPDSDTGSPAVPGPIVALPQRTPPEAS
jgi:type IV secretory pathway TraG/TraD family ATPase VirD4